MKCLVAGAGGLMGSMTAKTLIGLSVADNITLADLDPTRLDKFSDGSGTSINRVRLDVTDTESTRDLFADHDLVLNAVGPFYKFGLQTLKTAIEAGTHYADMCDDWRPTLDMIALSNSARDRGVTAIIGAGASPGVTNWMAMKAAEQLKQVDEIATAWSLEPSDLIGYADLKTGEVAQLSAIYHLVHELVEPFQRLEGGMLKEHESLEPFFFRWNGERDVATWSVGHPEGVTLSRQFPALKRSVNLMASRCNLAEFLSPLKQDYADGVSIEQLARKLVTGDYPPTLPTHDAPERMFAIATEVQENTLTRSGVTLSRYPQNGMAGLTGVPLAIMAQAFDEISDMPAGVFAPEEVVTADWFFNKFSPHCVDVYTDHSDLLVLQKWTETA